MKHTKGPWEISRGAQNYAFSIESGSKTIALVPHIPGKMVTKANAQLIAAVPELLEACERLLDDWHSDDANFYIKEPKHLELARQAIKKAKG